MIRKTNAEKADLKLARKAAPLAKRPAVRRLGALSEVADQPPLIALCMATLAAGLVTRNRRLASAGGRMLAAELLATGVKIAIKNRVDRTRPRVVDGGEDYAMRKGHSRGSARSSFPSGHTAGAVAVARALAREYPGATLPAGGAALAIAAIQIPRGQHYATDLVAGAAVGLAAEGLVYAAERLLARTV
jgi:membrane-associated phospholipid phosphatase